MATDGQNDMPMLDNAEIPLITPGQRARSPNRGSITATGSDEASAATETARAQEKARPGRHQDAVAGSATSFRNSPRISSSVLPENTEIDAGLPEAFHQIEKGDVLPRHIEVWREDYLDQVAVAWVFAFVFVRFMEDDHLIDECWLAGEGERPRLAEDLHELFFREHPHETDRKYFQHVFQEGGKIPAAKDLFAEGKTALWAVSPSAMRR